LRQTFFFPDPSKLLQEAMMQTLYTRRLNGATTRVNAAHSAF
jgi:hypothetical protein